MSRDDALAPLKEQKPQKAIARKEKEKPNPTKHNEKAAVDLFYRTLNEVQKGKDKKGLLH
jgi:hypothetical protein